MTKQEKIRVIEEMMELGEGILEEGTVLKDLEEWNSLAKLSLIAILDEQFGRKISADEIKALKTVQDILQYME
jgi:acyl carrier protein